MNKAIFKFVQVMLDLSYQYKLMATPEDLTQLWYDYEDQVCVIQYLSFKYDLGCDLAQMFVL